jgi:hypothetical protein
MIDWELVILTILLVIVGLVLFALIGWLGYEFYLEKTSTSYLTADTAVVIGKEYRAPYTTLVSSGKVITTIYHPAQYLTWVSYKDEKHAVDNEILYSTSKNGETVSLLVRHYIRKGKQWKIELSCQSR